MMTPQKINDRLAKEAMGWKVFIGGPKRTVSYQDLNTERGYDSYAIPVADWNPHEDVEQALMCVDEILKRNPEMTFELFIFVNRDRSAVFIHTKRDGKRIFWEGKSDNSATAICLAIIAVIEKEKNQ